MVTETQILPPVQQMLDELHTQYVGVVEGEVASYIPELTRAVPEHFGIAVVALDGHTYTVGECDVPFTIQSISKPFVYGLALEDRGESYVLQRVGLEPTGDAFNAISLDPESGRPSNPMINAGAIATAGMILAEETSPLERVLAMFARYVGHEVTIDEAVYHSESETGHRNRAIGHLLRNFEILTDDPEAALDLYFRQCSVSVTCRDLAMMAATLANGGVNPVTGERAIPANYVNNVLSIMGTCGMYNYAGEWIYRVGMPAKSGVSGGVLASLAGQVGVGVYSPRLDARGNSVRGVLVCDSLSRVYSLNMLNVPNVSADTVRLNSDATQVASKRQRTSQQRSVLDKHGGRIRVYELQGQLNFASVERFSRDVVMRAPGVDYFAIDFKMPARIDHGATELFCDLLTSMLDEGKMIAMSDAEHLPGLAERVEGMAMTRAGMELAENLDRGIEWCEDRLLEAEGALSTAVEVPLAENEFCRGMSEAVVAELMLVGQKRTAAKGARIVRVGDEANSVFLLISGEVSVTVDMPDNEYIRLATHAAGTAFGDLALVREAIRTSDITADTDIEYYELDREAIMALGGRDPSFLAAVYHNVAEDLAAQLNVASAEIRALYS